MVHTVDRWVSGAGSQVDSSVLARSSLRLGSMSGLDDVGRWPWLLLGDGSRWTWGRKRRLSSPVMVLLTVKPAHHKMAWLLLSER
jgi:hypothetical protein